MKKSTWKIERMPGMSMLNVMSYENAQEKKNAIVLRQ